jgi:hypothetical protein
VHKIKIQRKPLSNYLDMIGTHSGNDLEAKRGKKPGRKIQHQQNSVFPKIIIRRAFKIPKKIDPLNELSLAQLRIRTPKQITAGNLRGYLPILVPFRLDLLPNLEAIWSLRLLRLATDQ